MYSKKLYLWWHSNSKGRLQGELLTLFKREKLYNLYLREFWPYRLYLIHKWSFKQLKKVKIHEAVLLKPIFSILSNLGPSNTWNNRLYLKMQHILLLIQLSLNVSMKLHGLGEWLWSLDLTIMSSNSQFALILFFISFFANLYILGVV